MSDGAPPTGRTTADIEAEIRALEHRLEALRAELATVQGTVEAPTAEEAGGAIRVVIADDDDDIRELVGTLVVTRLDLELMGVASNAEEAVQQVLQHKPHVAVLDLSMPKGGGVWAAQQILRELPETRIVAFTAHDTPDAQFDVMRAGAVAFLLKGVRNEEILATIRKAAASAPGRPQG